VLTLTAGKVEAVIVSGAAETVMLIGEETD
jgi:hypothetical protein